MIDLFHIAAYAVLPAAGNLIGALIAESVRPPKWVIGAALHGAAGVAIALISFDLMPRIRPALPTEAIAIGFSLGAGASFLLSRGVLTLQSENSGSVQLHAWMAYAAIGADLFSDGLMTGAGSAVALKLGLLLAAAQLIANIPGGFAASANLRRCGIERRFRLGVAGLMFAPVIVSAAFGYVALRGAPDSAKAFALAFVVGFLLLATIEDMIPEGDAPRPPRWSSTLAFSVGFAGLALISAYVP